jgi:hypothetical protein
MNEKETSDKKLEILKVIERHQHIRHKNLITIIVTQKKLMAKKTLEKYIRELEDEKRISGRKFGKEKQYVLRDNELTESELEEKFLLASGKLKKEIETLEKSFNKFELYTKRNLPDYLYGILQDLQETVNYTRRRAKEQKLTDMSEEYELHHEIIELDKKIPPEDPRCYSSVKSGEIVAQISKLKNEYVKLDTKKNNMKISKKREEISNKMKENSSLITKLFLNLVDIKKSLS